MTGVQTCALPICRMPLIEVAQLHDATTAVAYQRPLVMYARPDVSRESSDAKLYSQDDQMFVFITPHGGLTFVLASFRLDFSWFRRSSDPSEDELYLEALSESLDSQVKSALLSLTNLFRRFRSLREFPMCPPAATIDRAGIPVFAEEPDWTEVASLWDCIDGAYTLNMASRDDLFNLATQDGVPWSAQPWKLRVCRLRVFRTTKHIISLDGFISRFVEDRGAFAPPWLRADDSARLPTRMKRLLEFLLVSFQ